MFWWQGLSILSFRPLQDEPEICTQRTTYTAEPETEDDGFQGTSRKATGLHENTKRQGGEPGWDASAKKSLPKDKAKPRAERSQMTPSRLGSDPKSSISGFTFTTNGSGSIRNENVGVIYDGA